VLFLSASGLSANLPLPSVRMRRLSGLTASYCGTGHAIDHSSYPSILVFVATNRRHVARDGMALMMRLCLLLLLFAPAFVAEESSFALWTPAAVGQREAALMKNVAPDHS
jgi:hypothetical protein